ncbi:hypothetical protein ABVK25_010904 [Lepraria finkii]|uniref:C2H2-type domain-containing protein n=1 Tax=Lepraria finkii TaxID=1340010 RepID=A0ABR4AVK5_9LECA
MIKMPSCHCGRSFGDPSALQQHQRSKFHCYCRECDRFFVHPNALEQHRSALHNCYSREAYAKKGWGSRNNFQLSYGFKPGNSEDWEEGNRILDAMIEADMENQRERPA